MKKGLELSINFLIIVIIGIVLLFLGISFFRTLMTGAQKIKTNYDQRTAEELENLLIRGERVAVPYPNQDIMKGDTIVFALGIYNAIGHNSNFKISVNCDTAFKGRDEIIGACDRFNDGNKNTGQILYNANEMPIKNNEREKMSIAISFPKNVEIATYVFNVCVCNDDLSPVSCTDCGPSWPSNLYESVHKLYVNVK